MGNRLYVANLSASATKESLLEAFAGTGGEVTEVHLTTDAETGQPTGIVTMASAEHAANAIALLDGAKLDEHVLSVRAAKELAGLSPADPRAFHFDPAEGTGGGGGIGGRVPIPRIVGERPQK
ncbi:MAG: RNA-binding protein [Polyangiaceae bacterium]|nr:RNA-binding protein [Polyangiaceae bacterium]